LTYAILNETSALSMTVVPSVRNAFTGQIKVACQSDKPVKGAFFITSGIKNLMPNYARYHLGILHLLQAAVLQR
jgi:hypothetical protein